MGNDRQESEMEPTIITRANLTEDLESIEQHIRANNIDAALNLIEDMREGYKLPAIPEDESRSYLYGAVE